MSVSSPAVSESGLRTMRGDKHLRKRCSAVTSVAVVCQYVRTDGAFLLGFLQLDTHSHKC